MTREGLAGRIEEIVRDTATQVPDATLWGLDDYKDSKGRSPMNLLVQRILAATVVYSLTRED